MALYTDNINRSTGVETPVQSDLQDTPPKTLSEPEINFDNWDGNSEIKDDKKSKSKSTTKSEPNINFDNWDSPTIMGEQYKYGDLNVKSYAPYFEDTGGVYNISKLDRFRSQKQSSWEQLGIGISRIPQNIVGGLIKDIGYIGELLYQPFNDTPIDYNNSLIEAGEFIKKNNLLANLFSKNDEGNIYRKNPNSVVDWTDPAWYIDNGTQGIESVIEFYLLGAGVGKVAQTGLRKMTGGVLNLLNKGSRTIGTGGEILQGINVTRGYKAASIVNDFGASLFGSGTMAYVEGAQTGQEVYNTVDKYWQREENKEELEELTEIYNKENGVDYSPEQYRKVIASQSASKSVAINTLMNTGMNMYSMIPLFKSARSKSILNNELKKGISEIEKSLKRKLTKEELQATQKYLLGIDKSKITGLTDDIINTNIGAVNASKKNMFTRFLGETFTEGVEEVNTEFARAMGIEAGTYDLDKTALDELKEQIMKPASSYLDVAFSKEGMNSFFWGAALGGGHIVAGNILKTQDVYEYDSESGQVIKSNIKGRNRTAINSQIQAEFDRQRAEVISDIEKIQNTKTQIDSILDKTSNLTNVELRQVELLQKQLFLQTNYLKSLRNGTEDIIIDDLREIANLNPQDTIEKHLKISIDEYNSRIEDANNKKQEISVEGDKLLSSLQETMTEDEFNQIAENWNNFKAIGDPSLIPQQLQDQGARILNADQIIENNLGAISQIEEQIKREGNNTIQQKLGFDEDHISRMNNLINIAIDSKKDYDDLIAYSGVHSNDESSWAEEVWRTKQSVKLLEELYNDNENIIKDTYNKKKPNSNYDTLLEKEIGKLANARAIFETTRESLLSTQRNIDQLKLNIESKEDEINKKIESINQEEFKSLDIEKKVEELVKDKVSNLTDLNEIKKLRENTRNKLIVEEKKKESDFKKDKEKRISELNKDTDLDILRKELSANKTQSQLESELNKVEKELDNIANALNSLEDTSQIDTMTANLALQELVNNSEEIMTALKNLPDFTNLANVDIVNLPIQNIVDPDINNMIRMLGINISRNKAKGKLDFLLTPEGKSEYLKEYKKQVDNKIQEIKEQEELEKRKQQEKLSDEIEADAVTPLSDTSKDDSDALEEVQSKLNDLNSSDTGSSVKDNIKIDLEEKKEQLQQDLIRDEEEASNEEQVNEDNNFLPKDQFNKLISDTRGDFVNKEFKNWVLINNNINSSFVKNNLKSFKVDSNEYNVIEYKWKNKKGESGIAIAPVATFNKQGNIIYVPIAKDIDTNNNISTLKVDVNNIIGIYEYKENQKQLEFNDRLISIGGYTSDIVKGSKGGEFQVMKLIPERLKEYTQIKIKGLKATQLKEIISNGTILRSLVKVGDSYYNNVLGQVIDSNEQSLVIYNPRNKKQRFVKWTQLVNDNNNKINDILINNDEYNNILSDISTELESIKEDSTVNHYISEEDKVRNNQESKEAFLINNITDQDALNLLNSNYFEFLKVYFDKKNIIDRNIYDLIIEANKTYPTFRKGIKQLQEIGISTLSSIGDFNNIIKEDLGYIFNTLNNNDTKIIAKVGTEKKSIEGVITGEINGLLKLAVKNKATGETYGRLINPNDLLELKFNSNEFENIHNNNELPEKGRFNNPNILTELFNKYNVESYTPTSIKDLVNNVSEGDYISLKDKKNNVYWYRVNRSNISSNKGNLVASKYIKYTDKQGDLKEYIKSVRFTTDDMNKEIFIIKSNNNISEEIDQLTNDYNTALNLPSKEVITDTRKILLSPGLPSAHYKTRAINKTDLNQIIDNKLLNRGDILKLQTNPIEGEIIKKGSLDTLFVWEVLPNKGIAFISKKDKNIVFRSLDSIRKQNPHSIIFNPNNFRNNVESLNNLFESTKAVRGVTTTLSFSRLLREKNPEIRKNILNAMNRVNNYITTIPSLNNHSVKIISPSERKDISSIYSPDYKKESVRERPLIGILLNSSGKEIIINNQPIIVPIPNEGSRIINSIRKNVPKEGLILPVNTVGESSGFTNRFRIFNVITPDGNKKMYSTGRYTSKGNLIWIDNETGKEITYPKDTITKTLPSGTEVLQDFESNTSKLFFDSDKNKGFMYLKTTSGPNIPFRYNKAEDVIISDTNLSNIILDFLKTPNSKKQIEERGTTLTKRFNSIITTNIPIVNKNRGELYKYGLTIKANGDMVVRMSDKLATTIKVEENGEITFSEGHEATGNKILQEYNLNNPSQILELYSKNVYIRPEEKKWIGSNENTKLSIPILNKDTREFEDITVDYQKFFLDKVLRSGATRELSTPDIFIKYEKSEDNVITPILSDIKSISSDKKEQIDDVFNLPPNLSTLNLDNKLDILEALALGNHIANILGKTSQELNDISKSYVGKTGREFLTNELNISKPIVIDDTQETQIEKENNEPDVIEPVKEKKIIASFASTPEETTDIESNDVKDLKLAIRRELNDSGLNKTQRNLLNKYNSFVTQVKKDVGYIETRITRGQEVDLSRIKGNNPEQLLNKFEQLYDENLNRKNDLKEVKKEEFKPMTSFASNPEKKKDKEPKKEEKPINTTLATFANVKAKETKKEDIKPIASFEYQETKEEKTVDKEIESDNEIEDDQFIASQYIIDVWKYSGKEFTKKQLEKPELLFNKDKLTNNLKETINNIIKYELPEGTEFLKDIAKVIIDKIPNNIDLNITNKLKDTIYGKAIDSSEVQINENILSKGILSETILHEAIHILTSNYLKDYNNFDKPLVKELRDLIRTALDNKEINAMYLEYLKLSRTPEYKATRPLLKKDPSIEANPYDLLDESSPFYALTSISEFTSIIMTNRTAQEVLSKIPYKKENLLTKFISTLTNLINSIFGNKFKKDSVTYHGINTVLNLIDDIPKDSNVKIPNRRKLNLSRILNEDKANKQQVNKEIKWFRENISDRKQDFELVKGLIKEGGVTAVGAFTEDGRVLISNQAPNGTIYHEAFERVWNTYLTVEEQQEAINEFMNRDNFEEEYNRLKEIYKGDSMESIIKEAIAEDFRMYNMIEQETDSNIINRIFKRLKSFINKLLSFGKRNTREGLQKIYNNINTGYYKSYFGKNLENALDKLEEKKIIKRIC